LIELPIERPSHWHWQCVDFRPQMPADQDPVSLHSPTASAGKRRLSSS
jgi:hypothetical protein